MDSQPGTTFTLPARHWLYVPGVSLVNECPFEVTFTLSPAIPEGVARFLTAGELRAPA